METNLSAVATLLCLAKTCGRHALDPAELSALLPSFGVAGTSGPASVHAIQLRFELHHTREFGLVLSAGVGGLDGELGEGHFKPDRATVHAATALTDACDFLRLFRRTLVYQKLQHSVQGNASNSPDDWLRRCFAQLLALAAVSTEFTLRQLHIDGVWERHQFVITSACCEFAVPESARLPRPIHKIDHLVHPGSIGIIGVSASGMNFGRIILKNLVASGYDKSRLCIIREGEAEIDGIRCVPSLKALEHKLDLLIVAVAASAVYALVDDIINTDSVESVMLIPGSLGETQASREPAAELARRINAAHGQPGGGPIFLGANCLGVVSHPGGYDSWFIPLERLPKPQKKPVRNSVMLSQSGAFMITRLSQNPWLDPRYMLALGNQTDLTHGDLLSYFATQPEVQTLGIYIEGFKDQDGLAFAKAVRQAVLLGKQVVLYKSGQTASGKGGVMGHTASIAGDASVFSSVLRQAGAMVAEDFNSFDDLFYIAGALHEKTIGGCRLGGISGAGFESVGIADSTECANFAMEMSALTAETTQQVEAILLRKKLNALVEVRNPIDINPGADDQAHLQIVEAFLQDPAIDAVVVGLDPTAPSVRALQTSQLRPGFDISDPNSTVHLMPPLVQRNHKPVIGIIDGGQLYDAMSAALMDQGVCIFRNCARGTRALVRYVEARLYAASLKNKSSRSG